jgi:hypothetical protein
MPRATRSFSRPLAAAVLGLGVLLAAPVAGAADSVAPLDPCADSRITSLVDNGDLLINQAGDAGCVAARISGSRLRLEVVVLNPGWTYSVKSSKSDGSRVQLQFSNRTTGERVELRMEPGKTVIR